MRGFGSSDQRAAWPTSSALAKPPREWPPGPDDLDGWNEVLAIRPDLEPAIRRMADGLAYWVDRLRICGNGVVPAQTACAFRALWFRAFGEVLMEKRV